MNENDLIVSESDMKLSNHWGRCCVLKGIKMFFKSLDWSTWHFRVLKEKYKTSEKGE